MTIDELERCIGQLLELARARGVRQIDTGARDLYWQVPSPDWVDMSKQPALTVGSLDDDVSELKKLLEDPARASSVDFVRVAAVLQVISDELSG
jgi:hypothetical protein